MIESIVLIRMKMKISGSGRVTDRFSVERVNWNVISTAAWFHWSDVLDGIGSCACVCVCGGNSSEIEIFTFGFGFT